MIRFGRKVQAPKIAAVAAALAAAAAVIWLLVGPSRSDDGKGRAPARDAGRASWTEGPDGRGGGAGRRGAGAGADEGRDPVAPDGAPPAPPGGGPVPLPIEVRIEPGRRPLGRVGVAGADERGAMGAAGGPGAGEDAGGAGAGGERTPELERERRDAWVDRQERRNRLRVDVIAAELGLDEARAKSLGDAFDAALRAKVAFYDSLDPKALDEAALGKRNAEIRSELESRLLAVLGPKGYETYQQMEAEGRFFLPEEMKKPPPR